jgi:hypothetical protein
LDGLNKNITLDITRATQKYGCKYYEHIKYRYEKQGYLSTKKLHPKMKNKIFFVFITLALISCKKNSSNNSSDITHTVKYETSTTFGEFHYIESIGADGTMSYPDLVNGPFLNVTITPFKSRARLYIFAQGNSQDADITVKIFVDSILVKESTSAVEAGAEYFLN